ncbi:Nn.00g106780.m01.CDS01 [Neocucurbitaria sp. VM-36]
MRFLDLPHACALLLVGYFGSEATSSPHTGSQTDRILRAATKRSDLYRRSVRITKRFESELAYIDANLLFASQVKVNSQKPILTLEEVEHHLQDVECGDATMKLHFVDTSSARDARFACHDTVGGLIITSHETCNQDGERAVYRVHDVSFAEDGEALELSISRSSWQDAFDTFDISFGHTTENHLYRRHTDFAKVRRKRQDKKIDIPADTPDDKNTATFNLTSSLIDTTFSAESFLAGLEQLVPIPALPIEVGCKLCTTRGRLELTQGAIKIDATQIDLVPDIFQGGDDGKEITSVITGGFMELAATGMGAHLEMFARPKASGAFEIALFQLPILGFVIPGVGKAGAVFEPRVAVNFEISGGFEINYGIDVAVPDNSNIRIELTDIKNSGVNGFPGSTLTPLPFSVNVTDVDILLGLAFKPSIPIGFEFTDKLRAEVTVSMNLPRLDALLSTNAAANCGNQTGSNVTLPSAPYVNTTKSIADGLTALGPLVLVEANMSLTVDVAFAVALPLLPSAFQGVEAGAAIFSTAFPLVTSCVSPEDAFKSLTGIVAAPTSSVYYANATVKASHTTTPCNTTSTTVSATTTCSSTSTRTKTIYAPPAHATTNSSIAAPSYPIKEPPKPTETSTPSSSHVPPSPSSSTSTSSFAATTSILNIPLPSLPPAVTETPTTASTSSIASAASIIFSPPPVASELPPPAPVVSMPTGFLSPSNTSVVPVEQTGVVQFTGAAVPGAEVPRIRWRAFGWQVGVLGMSVMFGVVLV